MSKVYTNNVFLTVDPEVARKASEAKSYSALLDSLTLEQKSTTIMTGYAGNAGILSFEYSLGGGGGDQKMMKLRLVSTGSFFEKYFTAGTYADYIERINNKVPALKPCYFMFGVGDKLANWNGPFKCFNINSQFTMTAGGRREVNLEFVPAFGAAINNYYNPSRVLQRRIDGSNKNIYNYQQIVAEAVVGDQSVQSIVNTIEKVIKNYLQKFISSSNVLIILPKISDIVVDSKVNNVLADNREDLPKAVSELGFEIVSTIQTLGPIDGSPYSMQEQLDPVYENIDTISLKSYIPSNPSDYPNYYDALADVGKKWTKLLSEKNRKFNPRFLIEDNLKIIKLISDKIDKSIDPTQPVLIWGDEQAISQLIYAESPVNLEDRSIEYLNKFDNKNYRKDVINLIAQTEDSFKIDSTSNTPGDILEFRYNLENPNIISFNLQSFPAYISIYQAQIQDQIKAIIDGEKEKEKKEIKEKIKENIYDTRQFIYNNNSYVSQDLKKLYIYIMKDSRSLLQEKLENLEKEDFSLRTSVEKEANKLLLESQNTEFMNKLFINLSIRTLPFFKVTSISTIGKQCTIKGFDPQLIGVKIENKGSLLDGQYLIVGFKHIISVNDSYSEFTLVKNISKLENSTYKKILENEKDN